MLLAHAAHGNAVGAPTWLLVAALLVLMTLCWLALRSTWPAARLAEVAGAGRVLDPWSASVGWVLGVAAAAIGLAVWGLTVSAGLFALDEAAENLAPFIVNLQLLAGGMLLAAALGDWWRAASPFTTLARLLPDTVERGAPAWAGPVLLASFLWLVTCYHAGGQPRSAGIWLAAYTVATLAGGLVWGRWWVSTGEGFAVLFTTMARLAPLARDERTGRLRLRPPLSGLGTGPTSAALPAGAAQACILVMSTAVFSAVRRLDGWQLDVMGARSGWDRTAVDTLGWAFIAGVVSLIWLAATRRRPSIEPLAPLALGVVIAFLLTDMVSRVVDAVALLSDPYAKGWDLLGTANWFPDSRWQSSTRLAWAELGALALGAVLTVVVAHDHALATEKGRASAERALLPQLAAGTLLATAALLVLLR